LIAHKWKNWSTVEKPKYFGEEEKMEVLKQSEIAASVLISETEAKLLSLAVEYWQDAMDTGSPVVADLSERLKEIAADFDAALDGSVMN